MPKFRKKPVVVDAFQWTGANIAEMSKWAAETHLASCKRRGEKIEVGPDGVVRLPID